jgi:hypothetical protein
MVLCERCKSLAGVDIEVVKLSTYGQRETTLRNTDGSLHMCLFDFGKWEWDHHVDTSEITKSARGKTK